MSDLSSFSHRAPQNTVANTTGQSTSWRQIFKRAMEQSRWNRNHESRVDTIESNHMLSRFSSNQKFLILIACIVVFGVIVAFGIIRYLDLPAPPKNASAVTKGKSFLGITPSTGKAKPAPGKPFVAAPQTHPNVIWNPPPPPQGQQQPSIALAPQTPAATPMAPTASPQVAPALPAQPVASGKPAITPLVYQARHDKHFGGSCAGQLTLSSAGIVFHCADDPEGSVQIALNQIGAIDENGVETLSGKKYHFSIPGMSRNAEQSLFANWLHQVR
jgi:hypothetical protein